MNALNSQADDPVKTFDDTRSRLQFALGILNKLLPVIVLALMMLVIIVLRPNVMSYFGLELILKLSMPLVLASLSQMLIISLGDLDLSIGSFVGFITCVSAAYLATQPALAVLLLILAVLGYGAMGLLIHVRHLPSIIVTLGMSFVWLGLALLVLPTPGGQVPNWLSSLPEMKPPLLPLPIWFSAIVALCFEFGFMRSSYGVILRGTGGNARAVKRAGWSVLTARVVVYLAAGGCGVLSGLLLSALTTSGAPNIAPAYTLLSIAAVVLGGGAFIGGIVSPTGAVIGALTLTLVGSVLTFLNVPSVWQIGAQGALLIFVLLGRGFQRGNK